MPSNSSSQKPASEITGNVSLEDKENILKLKHLYGGDDPGRWGYQIKEDTTIVSMNYVPQLQGTRKNAVLEFELVVQSCQSPRTPSPAHFRLNFFILAPTDMCNGWDIAHGGMISTLLD